MDNYIKKFKNMKLEGKMLVVYITFIGICFGLAIFALQISLSIYDEKLYEKSLQELDFFTQKINDDLEEVENLAFTIAMDTEIQQQLKKISHIDYLSAEYSYEMYKFRLLLMNQASSHDIIKNIMYTDGLKTKFTVGEASGTIKQETYDELINRFHEARGGYIVENPSEEYPYLLSGRDVLEHLDASMKYLGSLIFTCDVEGVIEDKVNMLEAEHAELLVFSEDGIIYSGDNELMKILPDMEKKQGYEIIRYQGKRYFVCYLKSSQNGWTFVNAFPYSAIFGQTMVVKYLMIGGFIALLVASVFVMKKISRIITKPLRQLSESMQIVETGDFQSAKMVLSKENNEDETGMLAQEFKVMLEKIDVLIHENYEKQLLLQDTRYKMLQAQINPHFLYNTLNALNWMVKAGHREEAGKMIVELGKMLRATFATEPYTSVVEDIDLVRSYITIQQFRYQERVEFEVETRGNLKDYMIPHMTLQPLVENAIYHGVEASLSYCVVTVKVIEEEETILLEVKDTGPGMLEEELEAVRTFTAVPKGNGIGLKNIRERLLITYEKSQLEIESAPGKGTTVKIRIPKMKKDEIYV